MRHSACTSSSSLLFLLLLVFLVFPVAALAGTVIHVPADQPTIQAGINAAANGDTVLVSPGTYKENVNFSGKAITVQSASGAAVTLIDGQQLGVVVTFNTNEKPSSVLSGFTIQNGNGYVSGYQGGGISITNASPTIIRNVIILNTNCGDGAAIWSSGGDPLIQENVIGSNPTGFCGPSAAIYVSGGVSGTRVTGNVIADNSGPGISFFGSAGIAVATSNAIIANGGGISFQTSITGASGQFVQNMITSNQGIGFYWSNPPLTLVNNTIANNSPGYSSGGSELQGYTVNNQVILDNNLVIDTGLSPAFSCIFYDTTNPPVLNNNDVFSPGTEAYSNCVDSTGTNGNVSVDPLFADLLSNNFHLLSGSPVVDVGDNSAPTLPTTDIDGDPRIINNIVDIGADEYSAKTTVTLSLSSLHYGSQDVGTSSSPQVVTLTNGGTSSVTIHRIAAGSDYAQTNTCGSVLAAGASCTISVSFVPVAGGTRNGVVGIFTGATLNPFVITLSGTGVAPAATLTPSSINFYNQLLGTQSSQTSLLTNTSTAALTITAFSLTGSTDFSQTNNCPLAPATLAGGASCTITITYAPTLFGYEYATLTVTDNANPSPQYLYLSGNSLSAGLATLSPSSLTFPNTLIGMMSSPQNVTLTNTGTGTLGSISITSSSSDFIETNNCGITLAVGASCTITITYAPMYYSGTEYSSVNVYSDGMFSPVYVSLTGTALEPVPTISSISPSSIAVGSGDTSVTVNGTGFVSGSSQAYLNGTSLYTFVSNTTQLSVTVPSASLATAGTGQITVVNPINGGGTSNPVTLTIFQPVNYAFQAAPFKYRTITGTNLNIVYGGTAQLATPFPVQIGGSSYTNLTIGYNGTVTVDGTTLLSNGMIPDSREASILISAFWDQLEPIVPSTDNNNVFWQVNGTAPNRELIVEWRNVPYCCVSVAKNTVTFEMVFDEGSSNILFNYADTVFGGSYASHDNGATGSVGVQVTSTLGTQYSYYTPSLLAKQAILWYPSLPNASVSTSVLNFGYHLIGSRSTAQKVTLTNGGLATLQISSVATNSSDFTQTNNCGTTLAAGASCAILVTFDPSQPVAESAILTITDNAVNTPQTVTLNGTGATSSIVVFPIAPNFGNVTVGQSLTLPVTLANASNSALSVQEITASPSVYTQSNTCGSSILAGAACTISVTFAPTQAGTVKGIITMGLNGKQPTTRVRMTGTGN